ncbi:MAG: hypothetical protein EOS58_27540 [Mesorhizobium sp.]|nr:hypothetical protein EJ072_06545 [Mesorhizobium sp. M2A.F.Ca.ET.046.03.2.1]AZO71599.1 hypothetical protein EJ067_10925 [Mesorhizobium sp. M1D.F.Ca.ET.043.01.1.1]RVC72849.1 hypothetical protein EN766_22450 [Mesorhizobium sp. M2A.F.Ca.ET.046.02.1.1]RWB49823.1 MAG: hypothetical protein EOQ44_01545 [Mesorhizobium sp.]RWD00874.1 MAG: hypothetical protein EOS58_27540 [Mesorhizobium sp.]
MATLIKTCLCRARHKHVYDDRRTMPSASSDQGGMKRFARHFDQEPLGIANIQANSKYPKSRLLSLFEITDQRSAIAKPQTRGRLRR